MSIVQGYTTENFAPMRDVLQGQLTSGEDVGASIAVIFEVKSSPIFGVGMPTKR